MKKQSSRNRMIRFVISIIGICLIMLIFVSASHFSAIAKDSGIPEDIVKAVNFFHKGRYKKAFKAFESVIQRDPNTPEAQEAIYYSAECLYALKDWAGAVERFKRFRMRSSNGGEIDRLFPHYADALQDTGDLSGAIALYEEWLKIHKDSSEAQGVPERLAGLKYRFTEDLMRQGEYEQASHIMAGLLEDETAIEDRWRLLKNLGDCFYFLKMWSDSIGIYEELRREYPEYRFQEQTSYRLMSARFAHKEWVSAIQEADQFLNDYPQSLSRIKAIYQKAWALYRSGEYQKAVDFLFAQPEIIPKLEWQNSDPWMKAEEERLCWNDAEPIAYFRKMVNDKSHNPDENNYWLAHIRLAGALWKDWKFQDASEIYRKIRDSSANKDLKIHAMIEEGEACFDQGWFKKAYDIFSSVIENEQDYPCADKILFLTAESLCRINRIEETRGLFQSLAERFGDSRYMEETRWRLAEFFYTECDFRRALESLDQFIHQYPDSPFLSQAIYLMGWSHIYLQELSNAERTFKKLLKSNPQGDLFIRTLFSLGQIYFHKTEYDKANKYFSKIVSQSKDNLLIEKAKFFIALGHFSRGKYSLAEKGFEELLNDKGGHVNRDVFILLGCTWQLEGQFKKANTAFKKILETYPTSFYSGIRLPLVWRLAKNSYISADYHGVLNWIDLILCEAYETPYRNVARVLKLQCLLDLKDYKGYLEMCDPFLDHNPMMGGDPSRDFKKARQLVKKGEIRKAMKLYNYLAIDYAGFPEEEEALIGLGMTQERQGHYRSALRTFSHAMDRCRGMDEKLKIHQAMGEILYKEKAYEFAERHFEKAYAPLSPKDLRARAGFFLGLVYHVQGRKEAARQKFADVFETDILKDLTNIEKMELGFFLEDESEFDLAINIFHKVLETEKNEKIKAEAQYWIGQCYQKRGDFERALHEYRQVNKLYPGVHIWDVTARFKSAEIYEKTGDLKKALALYRKVEKQGQGESYGRFAAERVDQIRKLIKIKEKGGVKK